MVFLIKEKQDSGGEQGNLTPDFLNTKQNFLSKIENGRWEWEKEESHLCAPQKTLIPHT